MIKNLPAICPGCGHSLSVKQLKCIQCDTLVEGNFDLPVLAALEQSDQEFIISFVKHSGSLKKMAKELSLSYPTVRNRLDEVIEKLDTKLSKSIKHKEE